MCRKVAEPLERIGGSAPAEEERILITREELENLLRAKGGVGTKACMNLLDFPSVDEPGSREWLEDTVSLNRKELHNICLGNGAFPLCDVEWNRTPYLFSSDRGGGGWIRVDSETLDKLLKTSGGEGVSHEHSMFFYAVRFDYNDSVPMPRTTFDHILELQGSSMASDAQWNMIMATFKNDMSRPTPKLTDFDWYAYDKIMSPSRREDEAVVPDPEPKSLTMTREQVSRLLESLDTPATVEEFFDEEDWMEQTLVTTTTLDQLNARLEYLNTLHPTEQMDLLTVEDFDSMSGSMRGCSMMGISMLRYRTRSIRIHRISMANIGIEWARVILNPEEDEQWDV